MWPLATGQDAEMVGSLVALSTSTSLPRQSGQVAMLGAWKLGSTEMNTLVTLLVTAAPPWMKLRVLNLNTPLTGAMGRSVVKWLWV
jgi:hypothetical protein